MSSKSSSSASQTPAYVDLSIIVFLLLVMTATLLYVIRLGRRWGQKEHTRFSAHEEKRVADYFEQVNGYSWDLVIVFKFVLNDVGDEIAIRSLERELDLQLKKKHLLFPMAFDLHRAGFELKAFYSVQGDEVYLKLRVDEDRLLKEAERIGYKLQYNAERLKDFMAGAPYNVEIPSVSPTTDINPYKYIYGPYEEARKDLFRTYTVGPRIGREPISVLREQDRIKLIMSIISAPTETEPRGCHINLEREIRKGKIMGVFPMHDYPRLVELTSRWMVVCSNPWAMKGVNLVKDYFGEKIGIYALWEQHLIQWFMLAAVCGVLAWINVAVANNDPDAPDIPYYAALVGVWTTLVLEFWKRRQNEAAMRWGMTDYELEERERHEFDGIEVDSPVTGEKIKYYPTYKFVVNVIATSLVTSGLIAVVLLTLIGFILLKIELRKSEALFASGVELGSIIVAMIQALVMVAYDYAYTFVSIKLNRFENHRTETDYEDSLIIKTFAFRFMNNYPALLYIAFAKPFLKEFDPCTGDSCMKELQVGLGTIFLTKLLFNLAYTVIMPIVDRHLKERDNFEGVEEKELEKSLSLVEWTFMKADYDELGGTLEDYATSVILFGYTTMFIAAFPLATCMSLFSAFIETRLAAWKFAYVYRRPIPKGAADMGMWYHILELMACASVLVNAGLVAFTGTYAAKHTAAERVWIFVGMSICILLFKFVVAVLIPDVTLRVSIQLQRGKFFQSTIAHHEHNLDLTKKIGDMESALLSAELVDAFVAIDHIEDNDEDP